MINPYPGEIRVTRDGPRILSVLWDPCVEGEPSYELTGMGISKIESTIRNGSIQETKLTIFARLVEIEAP